jgi:hypothetical protein
MPRSGLVVDFWNPARPASWSESTFFTYPGGVRPSGPVRHRPQLIWMAWRVDGQLMPVSFMYSGTVTPSGRARDRAAQWSSQPTPG